MKKKNNSNRRVKRETSMLDVLLEDSRIYTARAKQVASPRNFAGSFAFIALAKTAVNAAYAFVK